MMPHDVLIALICLVAAGAAVAAFVLWKKRSDQAKLTAFYDGDQAPDGDPMVAANWTIGPHPYGVNRSVGCPDHPEQVAEGLRVAIPVGNWDGPPDERNETDHSNTGGHMHGWVHRVASLAGKKGIRLVARFDAPDGVGLRPHTGKPEQPILFNIAVQRVGDDWKAIPGRTDQFRQYAEFAGVMRPTLGAVLTIDAPFTGPWHGINDGMPNPAALADVLANAEAIHLCFGGGSGLEHGIYATGPGATFTLLSLEVY